MVYIPADVPAQAKELFVQNAQALTRGKDRLFLFAVDQKIEHLNADFNGANISSDSADIQHVFRIAQAGHVGALATQLGLIARYAAQYNNINYVVKLNSKTNLAACKKGFFSHNCSVDPISTQLWSVQDIIAFKKNSGLPIRAIGYTIYLGSIHEHEMLAQAAQAIYSAHQEGLLAILWIYPRGAHVAHETDSALLAGAAGVANALGADIVKLHTPKARANLIDQLHVIKKAAGNTLVILAGGTQIAGNTLLSRTSGYISSGAIDGVAIGRNIFQRSLQDAIAVTQEIERIVYK